MFVHCRGVMVVMHAIAIKVQAREGGAGVIGRSTNVVCTVRPLATSQMFSIFHNSSSSPSSSSSSSTSPFSAPLPSSAATILMFT